SLPETAPPRPPRRTRRPGPGRRWWSAIHRRAPLGVRLVVAVGDPEVDLTDLLRHRPDLSVAYDAPVDLHARRDLRTGAAEEDLVSHVQLRAIDLPLPNEDPELCRDLEDRVACDALEAVVGHRRRNQRAVADHEDVRAGTLGDLPAGGEEDRLIGLQVVRLVHRERGVDIRAGQLAARRDRVVGRAAPARGPRGEPTGG